MKIQPLQGLPFLFLWLPPHELLVTSHWNHEISILRSLFYLLSLPALIRLPTAKTFLEHSLIVIIRRSLAYIYVALNQRRGTDTGDVFPQLPSTSLSEIDRTVKNMLSNMSEFCFYATM